MPPGCLVYSTSAPSAPFAASMRATAASIAPAARVRHSPSPTQSGDAASACKRWDFCVRCGVRFVDRRYVAEFGDLDA